LRIDNLSRTAIVTLLCTLSIGQAVHARWESSFPWEEVPVNRLINNLEKREERLWFWQINDKAEIEFQIGRLHSMAYAQKLEIGKVAKGQNGPDELTPYYPPWQNDSKQFLVATAKNKQEEATSEEHLKQAIAHLQRSVSMKPSSAAARLGLAWCQDQAGQKDLAIVLYREAFDQAFKQDSDSKSHLAGQSVVAECGPYLCSLLDPVRDAQEIKDIKAKVATMKAKFTAITPIVVALTPESNIDFLLQKASVRFNLDGQGARECTTWISKDAGWLVYDTTPKGEINSGRNLIGAVTFWVFWNDGYKVLKTLDNDHDGKLIGEELNHLAIWRDLNSDGIAQIGEIKSLSEWHITEVACSYKKISSHLLFNKRGVKLSDGTTRATYDAWIDQKP
jgi:tetratricopeptide (TPR) repeat protein